MRPVEAKAEDGENARARTLLLEIPSLVNADDVLVRRGRFMTADVHVVIDAEAFILPVREGRVGTIEPATTPLRSWSFSVRASAEDWLRHWREPADAGWYDILGMRKTGRMTIEGDLKPLLQNLQYVKDVLASPRSLQHRPV